MSNCPECGNPIGEKAAYCGACGSPLTELSDRYAVYNYSAKVAKTNGAYVTFGKVYGKALLFMMPALIAAIICPIVFGDKLEYSLGIPLALAAMALACIILYTVSQAPFVNAAQQTLVFDRERRMYYLVRFHQNQVNGWDTATRAAAALHNADARKHDKEYAQKDALCIQLVEEYQKEGNQPSAVMQFFFGSDMSVIELKDLKVTKRTQKAATCTYTDIKNKSKKLLVPNVYPFPTGTIFAWKEATE